MSKRDGCKQGCCRVQWGGVCARKWNCACHQPAIRAQAEIDALEDLFRES